MTDTFVINPENLSSEIKAKTKDYIESGRWHCPDGKPHYWIIKGDKGKCKFCGEERDFPTPKIIEQLEAIDEKGG